MSSNSGDDPSLKPPPGIKGNVCVAILYREDAAIPIIEIVLAFPTILFMLYLIYNAKRSIQKLLKTDSLIMGSYYKFVWIVSTMNILRLVVQLFLVGEPAKFRDATDAIWLLVRWVLLILEISVVVFMSHKHVLSGRQSFRSTLKISAIIATILAILMGVMVFGFNIPLFIMAPGDSAYFWVAYMSIASICYFILIILPYTRYASKLPERPEFFRYVFMLFCISFIADIGAILIAFSVGFGYCFWDLAYILYYSLYAPVLYVSFLHDFLSEGSGAQTSYYEAMLLEGYLDTDM